MYQSQSFADKFGRPGESEDGSVFIHELAREIGIYAGLHRDRSGRHRVGSAGTG